MRPSELALSTRQLATLLGAGFPLVSALGALLPQTTSTALQRRLVQVKDAVTGGSRFAEMNQVLPVPTLLEPLMILLLGVAVAFVVLAVCLPIFEMNRLIM